MTEIVVKIGTWFLDAYQLILTVQFCKTNKIRAIVKIIDNSSYFSFSSFPLKGQ